MQDPIHVNNIALIILMYTSIFFRFTESIMTPAYNPQKKAKKVNIPYHKANVEL